MESYYLKISDKIRGLSKCAILDVAERFDEIDRVAELNTEKVLRAFHSRRVSDVCFNGTTGYGYNDKGRDTLDEIYAEIMGAQSGLVRTGFVNGTHAITCALFAAVRPGQTLLSVTGLPYDTIHGVIGIRGEYAGSLKDYGISYAQIELGDDGGPDHIAIAKALKQHSVGAVLIQRSRGYALRRAMTVREIGEICKTVKEISPNVNVFVDNCYGEFVEEIEPGNVGVDIIAGSLIKNPGGGIAPNGGYIAGRKELVEAAAYRLTTPGIGAECGATLGINRLYYQGLFLAPHTVAQALKTAVFCARLLELLGYKTTPGYNDFRSDIIQRVEFGEPELLERFCAGVQAGAPVDSYVTPVAWDMPGYDHQVIMAAGAFVQGSSIELSADGPMRPPYAAYLQGGLTFESGKLGIMLAASFLEGNIKE